MSAGLPNKVQFDTLLPQLQALARDWAERECSSFDAAVLREAGNNPDDDGSIWDMPAIDSKRTVSLLVELEGLIASAIGGTCKVPVAVIKSGGYASVDDLLVKLFAKIRERCPDAEKPGIAAATVTSPASKPPPPQVMQ